MLELKEMAAISLRTLARKMSLARVFSPLIVAMEQSRLAAICNYTVDDSDLKCVRFRWGNRMLALPAASSDFRQLAISPLRDPTTTIILSSIAESSAAWDVGAHIGFFSCLMARLAGDKGCVVAFEPNAHNHCMLKQHIADSGLAIVRCLQVALSDQDGVVAMIDAQESTTISRVQTGPRNDGASVAVVSACRADTLVATKQIPVPSFIKIDVEGYELEVLRGMVETLAQPLCRTVFCEVHFRLLAEAGQHQAVRHIRNLLREAGFVRIRWVARSHLLASKS